MSEGLTLLVDVSSLAYRAFFSTPDTVRALDGTPANAAHGFLEMLGRLVSDNDPDFMCCAIDEDWRPAWRVELIDSYKTHRMEPDSVQQKVDSQIAVQMLVIFRILELCGIQVVGEAGYEAEDVIGTLAARAPGRTAIVSGDRDLFQLVRDPDVFVIYPKRGVSVVDLVDEAYIEDRFGIPGRAYLDYAVLRGDPSDGLPGVKGIGEKLASSLLTRYGTLERIIAEARSSSPGLVLDKVRRDLDYVERAVEVVTIPTDLPLSHGDLTRPRGDPDEALYVLAEQCGVLGPARRLVAALKSGRVSPS